MSGKNARLEMGLYQDSKSIKNCRVLLCFLGEFWTGKRPVFQFLLTLVTAGAAHLHRKLEFFLAFFLPTRLYQNLPAQIVNL